ncbi:hypothetical protein PENTCL1PPCAC_28957, partial [Pristionchus entomophagus]
MRFSLILPAVFALGLSYDITFVNKCSDVVNVQYEQNNDKCTGRLLTALSAGKAETFNLDSVGSKTFRRGSNGKTVASTYSEEVWEPSIIYGLNYKINIANGFDVAMQFHTDRENFSPSAHSQGTIQCLDSNCNSGKDWFGNTQQYVEDSTVKDANFTLTFCP